MMKKSILCVLLISICGTIKPLSIPKTGIAVGGVLGVLYLIHADNFKNFRINVRTSLVKLNAERQGTRDEAASSSKWKQFLNSTFAQTSFVVSREAEKEFRAALDKDKAVIVSAFTNLVAFIKAKYAREQVEN